VPILSRVIVAFGWTFWAGVGVAEEVTPHWDPVVLGLDVQFELHATGLPAERRLMLPRLAEYPLPRDPDKRRRCPAAIWIVIGHADHTEKASLARERSLVVANLLVRLGVPKERICTANRGNWQPVALPPSARNARVEIEVACAPSEPPKCD
jgi:outer membrane protein OmpA-like peptidoglycan-associated protein